MARTNSASKSGKAPAAPKPAKKAPKPEPVALTAPVEGEAEPQEDKPSPVPMFTPKHGKGKLRHGSAKGNTPGPGRPPNIIRAALREAFADRVPLLMKLADSPALEPRDRIKALEMLARYGLGTKDEVDMTTTLKPLIVREVDEAPEAG